MSSVSELLCTHHATCDRELDLASEAAAFGDWGRCAERFECFRSELSRHIRLEEEELFPAFERASGSPRGPTVVMRREHRTILELTDALAQSIGAGDGTRFQSVCTDLLALIRDHNAKEERILYPACDRLPGEDLPRIVGRIRTLLAGP